MLFGKPKSYLNSALCTLNSALPKGGDQMNQFNMKLPSAVNPKYDDLSEAWVREFRTPADVEQTTS